MLCFYPLFLLQSTHQLCTDHSCNLIHSRLQSREESLCAARWRGQSKFFQGGACSETQWLSGRADGCLRRCFGLLHSEPCNLTLSYGPKSTIIAGLVKGYVFELRGKRKIDIFSWMYMWSAIYGFEQELIWLGPLCAISLVVDGFLEKSSNVTSFDWGILTKAARLECFQGCLCCFWH